MSAALDSTRADAPPAIVEDEASALDLALAVDRVQRLVLTAPDAVLWSPGRARWGLALVGGDRGVIALDGCLALAAMRWPRLAPRRVDLHRLAARLRGVLRVGAIDAARVFAHPLPGSTDGACCVLIALAALPWIAADRAPAPPTATTWPVVGAGAAP